MLAWMRMFQSRCRPPVVDRAGLGFGRGGQLVLFALGVCVVFTYPHVAGTPFVADCALSVLLGAGHPNDPELPSSMCRQRPVRRT